MKNTYDDNNWSKTNNWKWGEDDERGALNSLSSDTVLKALSIIKKGKIYDLETERFKGMPIWDGHCGFDIVSYASPKGRQNMLGTNADDSVNCYKDGEWMDEKHNLPEYHMGWNSEMLVTPLHVGTHIDALCHWTTGEDNHMYNGIKAEEITTNYGPAKLDISKVPPMIMRGVMLDIAGYKGLDHLEDGYIITAEDCEGCAKWEGIELRQGDAVFLRNGETWPKGRCGSAGVGITAARYLVEECGAILIGDDMSCLDGFHKDGSSSVECHPQPVHHYLLIQNGIHIMEFVMLNELAADKVYEFCFICAAPKVRYATGMFIRPIAVV